MIRPDILQEVQDELDHQQALKAAGKFEKTAGDYMREGDVHRAFDVLSEEVGEIARCHNEGGSYQDLREEWRQVCAVAMDALHGLDEAMVRQSSAI